MVTKAQKDAQDAAAKDTDAPIAGDAGVDDDTVHEGVVEDAPKPTDPAKPTEPPRKTETVDQRRARLQQELADLPPEPEPAIDPNETLEERRARLRAELARNDAQAELVGGYKQVPTHIGVLLCGHNVKCTNANATAHFCEEDQVEVNFVNFYPIPENLRQKIGAQ